MKGMSLALQTVVLLILMAIVLAALLGFFLGIFNPSQGKFEVLGQRDSLCLQYVSVDPDCDGNDVKNEGLKDSIKDKLSKNVYNKPVGDPVCTDLKSCCSSWCAKEKSS